jgi:hypothetical protein
MKNIEETENGTGLRPVEETKNRGKNAPNGGKTAARLFSLCGV